jgi:hypothetical protein
MVYSHWLAMSLSILLSAASLHGAEHPRRTVTFNHRDGDYTSEMMARDFGNGNPPEARRFARIRGKALNVTFTEGKKVNGTGLGLHVRVPAREAFELSYRIKFPEDFETGLHGKQFGLSGGRGYDGGRGDQARENGDGWSVRVQFDAKEEGVRQSLYVYHSAMTGKYGDGLGAGSFLIARGKWHELRLRVFVPSAVGVADGRIELWCDGEKRIEATGLGLVAKEEGRNVNRVRAEIFPGGGGIFPTREHVIEVDDFGWKPLAPNR